MPNLSIKNVPEEMLARLRTRARQHHRSLQGELMAILEEAVLPRSLTVEEAYQRVKALGVQTGDESTAWIRELRDALAPRRLTLDELVQRVKERGIRTGDESVAMVREDRDAR